jgi:HK97 family phage portal protein
MIGRSLRGAPLSDPTNLLTPAGWFRYFLGGERTRAGVQVTPESALHHADVFACIRVKSEDAGSLPLKVYQGEGNSRQVVKAHPTAAVLLTPAPTLTIGQLVETTVAHLESWGNALWAKGRDSRTGLVNRLYPIHPSRLVRVDTAGDGEPVYTIRASSDGSGFEGKATRADVIHFKAMSFDGLLGVSPITLCRESLALGMAAEEFASGWWHGNATPNGALNVKGASKLTDEQKDELSRHWQANHSGPENVGKVAILEAGMEYQPITLPLGDMQFMEQRHFSTGVVCRIFRMFPWMIGSDVGASRSVTYSNVESQQLAYVKHSLRPLLTRIEQTISTDPDLFVQGEDLYAEFLIDALLRGDSAARAAYYTAGYGKWLQRGDIRRAENLPTTDEDFTWQASAPPVPPAPVAPAPDDPKNTPPDPAADPKASE